MTMWIWRIVAMSTDMEANMHAVMPMVPMVPMVPPVMVPMAAVVAVVADMASGTFAVPVMAIMLPVLLGPVSRVALDVFAPSRI